MASDEHGVWMDRFLSDVEGGHAGKTMQLVNAIQSCSSSPDGLGVKNLCAALERDGSAVGRNRTFRSWLVTHRGAVLASWVELGFPKPSSSASSQLTPSDAHRTGSAVGVVVFDFDQTLTTRHVGVLEDLNTATCTDRIFGGATRLHMLRKTLEHIRAAGMLIGIVSRNSRHVVKNALAAVGLLGIVSDTIIFGFEDYEDEVPKSYVLKERILHALRLPPSEVLFLDDDPSNIKDVQENCAGVSLIKCQRLGLQAAEFEDIVAWVASRSQRS